MFDLPFGPGGAGFGASDLKSESKSELKDFTSSDFVV
jgi:hypothetical protein